MEVRLLGPLEVTDAERAVVAVSGARLQSLLAMLALEVGQVVSTDRLVDSLWGDAPPQGATNSLQGLVSRLRRALGSPDAIATATNGYVLAIDAEGVDVVRFE